MLKYVYYVRILIGLESFDFVEIFTCARNPMVSCIVFDTAESASALSLTPRSQPQDCLWHRGVSLSIVFDTVESASGLSLTPRSRSQHHCLWHRGVRLCSINDITESNKMSVIKRGSVTRILTLYFHDFDLWFIVSTFVHTSP